jgi:ABC-type glycerol-3-phosphate transport system substrate-binding protein
LYEDGYIRYPSPAIKGAPSEPPGAGSAVTALVDALYPPPTPLEQNPAWQEINKRLNATMQFNIVPPADYATKIATVMAGNDYPDIINFFGGLSAGPKLRFNDGLGEILQGHRPLADLDQLVTDWQSNGGEQMRKEYLDAMSATGQS